MAAIGWGDANRTTLAAPQPAAGASASVPFPQSESQTIIAVAFRLVTSAVVGTRTPLVTVTDGSGVAVIGVAAGFGLTASSTADYTFAIGLGEWDQSNNAAASGAMPPFVLAPGDNIVVSIGNGDVGDQLSRVRVTLMQSPVRGN